MGFGNRKLNMDKPLRILHLEDDPDFVSLVSDMLKEEGLAAEMTPTHNFQSFISALDEKPFDLILADYSLPTCNGLQALQAVRKRDPNTPFVLISGTIGEHAAIECLRCGATDYVLKNKLERLAPTVRRAVQEAAEREHRQRAESELIRREKYFRTLTEHSLDVLTILNGEGIFLYNSPSLKTVLGYEPKDLAGQNAFGLVHPEDLPGVMDAFRRALENPSEVITHEFRYHHGNGSWCHLEVVGQNRLSDPEIAGVVINTRDISERKRAAENLEKSQASLAAAQRIAHLGSWELDLKNPDDLNSNEVRWSDETYRIFGYEPRQIAITTEIVFKAVHPDDRPQLLTVIADAVKKGDAYDIEHRILLPNGQERYVRARGEIVKDAAGKPVQIHGIVMDITERRQLGEQLRQSQKMEAIGQLAGGVAHDFNNILTVIHGHASLLLVDTSVTKNAARSAQQIAQAAERAAGLTRQLLTFSRRQVMQPRRLDLNEVVSNMTMMLGRILGEDIALQLNYWPQPAFVKADASMIEQVLLNLVVNARDAMPKGGQLAIKIALSKATSPQRAFGAGSRATEFVCLNVTDNGSGIDPETLRHIFEPFFTTKEVGKGTGLGLATVYGIVNQHQGWIEVDSEIGRGSTFRVFLPAAKEPTVAQEAKAARQAIRGGTETILVVEDEIAVRELVCSVLGGHGYKILEAETGVKALDIWERNKKKIDLLLTDLVMPDHLNGRELAEKLREDKPKLKVIFTSGYSAEVVGKDFIVQRGLHYLQKPYDPQKLALTVRDCLDGKAQ